MTHGLVAHKGIIWHLSLTRLKFTNKRYQVDGQTKALMIRRSGSKVNQTLISSKSSPVLSAC